MLATDGSSYVWEIKCGVKHGLGCYHFMFAILSLLGLCNPIFAHDFFNHLRFFRFCPPILELKYSPGIMSYDQPSSATASIVQGCGSRESLVSPVTFNIDGQPIGDNAASLSTMIGRSVKNNIPPSFDKWSNVPDVMKEKVWDIVTNKYEIPIDNKEWVLMKANECWRNQKSKLKRCIYSKYHTDADRKKNVPKFVKKEDWESFIDMCSTYAAQEKSKLGKAARQAMRCPHTSGRKGQARVADELRRKNPDKEITRTDVWLETHTKKDGSASCEEAERVRMMHENNPSFAQGHLDQDPVARVCGRDTRGHVKGMGSGISKYVISHSAPYKRALEQEKKSNATLHTEVDQLKEQMREMQQILASHDGGQMRYSSNHGSSSQVRQDSARQEAQSNQATTDQSSSPLLKLLHLTKNTCVAYGRQSNESAEESSWKRIIIDEIVDGNVDLINGRGKMEDLTLGDAIDWPEFRIISI